MKFFDYEYRVRYADTDKMGISYYSNYLIWFEAARTEYFRALGLPYTQCEKEGLFLPVIEANIQYHSTSTYDDAVVVRTSVSEVGKTSMRFEYVVFKKGSPQKITSGFTAHVFVNAKMKPCRVPDSVRHLVEIHKLLQK